MSNENPCEQCDAKCCRYFALEIDKPATKRDFDDIRWYLCHEGTMVFVEKGRWYLEVRNLCRHLDANQRCRIYPDRPALCRKHSVKSCEGWDEGQFEHQHEFRNDGELARFAQDYLARRKRTKARKSKKS